MTDTVKHMWDQVEKARADGTFSSEHAAVPAQDASDYEACSRCGGTGLMLGGAGEPTECSTCKGNTVVRTPAEVGTELSNLRRDVIELREWKAAIIGKCRASDGFDALAWGGDKEGWGFIHYFIGHLETRALQAEAQVENARAQAIEECAKIADGFVIHEDGIIGFAKADDALTDSGRLAVIDRATARKTLAGTMARAMRRLPLTSTVREADHG